MRRPLRRVERLIETRGILGALAEILGRVRAGLTERAEPAAAIDTEPDFDRAFSVDTSGVIPQVDLDACAPSWVHGSAYVPVSPDVVDRLLDHPTLPVESATFLDLGCGKGRAILIAAGRPFERVVGVELSPTLAAIARDNLRRWVGPRRAKEVQVVVQDAATFPLPTTPLVVFLYHPFDEVVMRRVVGSIERSLGQSPRRVVVLYAKPVHGDVWERSDWFRRVESTATYAVFDNVERLAAQVRMAKRASPTSSPQQHSPAE